MESKRILSIHKPKKTKFYINDKFFGPYLAGLIDGDGHFSTTGQCVIAFSSKNARLAYQLRTQIGFGTVKKIKNKNAYKLTISHPDGIVRVANLVRDKLKHPNKIKQFNERLVPKYSIPLTSESSIIDWNTSWLSGFFDADGSFRIYLVDRPKMVLGFEVRLLARIDQKESILLDQIYKKFKGYMGYRKTQDTYIYSSTSFGSFGEFLQFFDKFSLQSPTKYLAYEWMRKAYLIVQKKEHLTENGFEKIQGYHKRLSELRKIKV